MNEALWVAQVLLKFAFLMAKGEGLGAHGALLLAIVHDSGQNICQLNCLVVPPGRSLGQSGQHCADIGPPVSTAVAVGQRGGWRWVPAT